MQVFIANVPVCGNIFLIFSHDYYAILILEWFKTLYYRMGRIEQRFEQLTKSEIAAAESAIEPSASGDRPNLPVKTNDDLFRLNEKMVTSAEFRAQVVSSFVCLVA